MTTETRAFDPAAYLATPEDRADLLSDALADGDHRYIAAALGAVARSNGGLMQLSSTTGLTRATLHKALSEKGNPTLATMLKVLGALGLRMHIERRETRRHDASGGRELAG